ncbi:Abi family protein [Enterococcus olivae]
MKPFKTLDEQMDLLEERGLTICNKEKTKRYLLEHSYYKVINVYSKFFQEEENRYIEHATFEEIRLVHIFDTELNSTLFKFLIECEKHFKSIVSHRFSEYYRDIPFAYLKTSSYDDSNILQLTNSISVLSKVITSQIRDRKANAIKHYYQNHQDIPLWVLISHLTFGQIVRIYTHFDNKLKNTIAKDLSYYLESNLNKKIIIEPKEVESILFNLIDIRNCVAHNNKLFDFKCKNNLKYIEEIQIFSLYN